MAAALPLLSVALSYAPARLPTLLDSPRPLSSFRPALRPPSSSTLLAPHTARTTALRLSERSSEGHNSTSAASSPAKPPSADSEATAKAVWLAKTEAAAWGGKRQAVEASNASAGASPPAPTDPYARGARLPPCPPARVGAPAPPPPRGKAAEPARLASPPPAAKKATPPPLDPSSFYTGFGAAAAVLAGPIAILSVYNLAATGARLPEGAYELVGRLEDLSFLVVAITAGASANAKLQTGRGLPAGPLGLLGLGEGLSYAALLLALLVVPLFKLGVVGDPQTAALDVPALTDAARELLGRALRAGFAQAVALVQLARGAASGGEPPPPLPELPRLPDIPATFEKLLDGAGLSKQWVAPSLPDGLPSLSEGMASLKEGMPALSLPDEVVPSLKGGIASLKEGWASLKEGAASLQDALPPLPDGAPSMPDGVPSVPEGVPSPQPSAANPSLPTESPSLENGPPDAPGSIPDASPTE